MQRCIYTTNWIERLNRKYKRTIGMGASMPSDKSALFLLASAAMEETDTTCARKIYQ
nr:transposase [Prevotella nigrescens]